MRKRGEHEVAVQDGKEGDFAEVSLHAEVLFEALELEALLTLALDSARGVFRFPESVRR
ncbi:MAG TPA: hypothetical protein VGK67_14150 [Myxococcales bacterium]|jgi:hypothetical protein